MNELPIPVRFAAYDELGAQPNIIVDGAPQEATVLTLSHWPKSGTPSELKRDTSAEIVFAYLDTPCAHRPVELASNNHFDEDGLIALYALIDPQSAVAQRELLVDVASAGDFGVFRSRDAVRIVFALAAFAAPQTSPFGQSVFSGSYEDKTAALYRKLLDVLPQILENPQSFQEYWREEDAHLAESINRIARKSIQIEERPALDLAIVRIHESLRATSEDAGEEMLNNVCHPFAIHNATRRNRILAVHGQTFELRYRYESWVQMCTAKPLPRVSLDNCCDELNAREDSGGEWINDPVDEITPRMYLSGSDGSSLASAEFITIIERHLREQEPAWDPYD